MRRSLTAAVVCCVLILTACGPLSVPRVERLDEEQQQQIDQLWSNMLTPPDRLDRDLLLDILTIYQLHHMGVDSLTLRSEKEYDGGHVVMSVYFERSKPDADRYVIEVYDPKWNLVRRESYRSEEVGQVVERLSKPIPQEFDTNGNRRQLSPEDEALLRAHKERRRRIEEILPPGLKPAKE